MEMTAVGEGTMAVFNQAMIFYAIIVDRQPLRFIIDGDFTRLHHKIMSSERSNEFAFFTSLLSTIGTHTKGM